MTLLRADVLGAAQASIVGRLRKRAPGSAAIAQAMAQIGDKAYADAVAAYTAVGEQLRTEMLAALAVLTEAGAPEAVILVDHLGGRPAVLSIIGTEVADARSPDDDVEDALRCTIANALRTAFADPASVAGDTGRKLVVEAPQRCARSAARASGAKIAATRQCLPPSSPAPPPSLRSSASSIV